MKTAIKLGFFALVVSSMSYFSAAQAGQFDLQLHKQERCGCERQRVEPNRCRENRHEGCRETRENRCRETRENRCHDRCHDHDGHHHHHHHHHCCDSSSSS